MPFILEHMETDSDPNVASSFYRTKKLISSSDNPDSMDIGDSDDKNNEKQDGQEKNSKDDEDITDRDSNDGSNKDRQKNDNKSDDSSMNFKNPNAVIKQFKDMYTDCSRENIRLHQIITTLQEQQHGMSLKVFIFLFYRIYNFTIFISRIFPVKRIAR